MQEPQSPLAVLESQHKYPDCLWMELEAIPVQFGATEKEQLDLYLTVKFNEQWESLLEGRVKFGLKGGELGLLLENCLMQKTSPQLDGSLSLSESKGEILVKMLATDSDRNLTWVFSPIQAQPVFHGLVEKTKLLTVQLTGKPSQIQASFTVSGSDVYVTEAEGLWEHNISPNKHGVLERTLVLFLMETRLTPYLSRIQLGSHQSESKQVPKDTSSKQAQTQLTERIQRICAAKTNEFLELAAMTGLNPKVDFAGGNLRGTDLSGIELNGADLHRVNLRGADLTDADLSETNLSHAKLSGADLSGAYLENADLRDADCHRASLALANSIGANLSGANLIEANLSNANLSSAKVEGTRFGNNPGISDEMKLNLTQRGAVWLE